MRRSVHHDTEQDRGSLSGFSVLILSRASNPGSWVQVPLQPGQDGSPVLVASRLACSGDAGF